MNAFFKSIFVLFSIFRFCTPGHANEQTPHYSTVNKEQHITLMENYSYLISLKQTTTIVNSEGSAHGGYRFVVDEFTKLEYFDVRIIDPISGKLIKRVREKDLKSRALISEGTFFQNLVLMYFDLDQVKFPARVEMEVKLHKTGNFNMPTWYPTHFFNQKVQTSTLEIHYPEALGMRYKAVHLDEPKVSSVGTGHHTFFWQVENMDPMDSEIKSADVPRIEIAPTHFAMQGYQATMDSWNSLGKWFHLLNQGKDNIPESTKSLVADLTKRLDNDYDKIKVLYQYLQKNYRYVSIQMGLGGWMPMAASDVVSTKYGDCKALTMLMKALLAEAGIDAYYTLVYAGEMDEPFDLDFPSNQFNHVILQIPTHEETLWLECTSSTLPAGYLGSFTKDRPALAITPEGGKIVHTPSYNTAEYNTTHLTLEVGLTANGDAEIKGHLLHKGAPAESLHSLAYQTGGSEKKDYLIRKIGGAGLSLEDHTLSVGSEKELPTADLAFSGWVGRFSQNTAKRTIIPVTWAKGLQVNEKTASGTISEETTVIIPGPLEWESGSDGWELKTAHTQTQIKPELSERTLKIVKSIHYSFPEDFSQEEKAAELSLIKVLLQQQFIFKKQL
jgi:hypothetical protein